MLGTEKETHSGTLCVSRVLNVELNKQFLLHAQRMLTHHRKLFFNIYPLQRTYFKERTARCLFAFSAFKMPLSDQRVFLFVFNLWVCPVTMGRQQRVQVRKGSKKLQQQQDQICLSGKYMTVVRIGLLTCLSVMRISFSRHLENRYTGYTMICCKKLLPGKKMLFPGKILNKENKEE